MRRARLIAALGLVAAVAAPALVGVSPASAANSHALIQSSGSSWAANAIDQWVADVEPQGLKVVYNPNGDATGRQDFANKTSDFAVTSLGYQGADPVTGVSDSSNGRPYAYLPIAAGGTAFPYQIKIHGVQIRDLRLSGETLTKIFTDQITNWNDPEITADNNGHQVASDLPIVPVVQSEGSGATAQLTRYFATEYPSIWKAFSHSSGLTEYFPQDPSSNQIQQNGSDGAMNFISSKAANGSIGYVEYSYALSQNYPVAKMLNSAGYYTLPTQYNVAVALEKAVINENKNSPNYLLQDLDNVYTDTDVRTYPLSSYVYMIEPTGTTKQDGSLTTAKRQTIADFAYYSICQGQKEIGPIGYSPLPVNLVEAGFGQIAKLKTADAGVDLTNRNVSTCDNPTFVKSHPDTNHLAQIAPLPPACDKTGAGPCAAGVTPNGAGTDPNKSGTVPGEKNTSAPTTQLTNPTGISPGINPGTNPNNNPTGTGLPSIDGTAPSSSDGQAPDVANTDPANASTTAGGQVDSALNAPAELEGYHGNHRTRILAPLAVILLILALVLPPVIAVRMSASRNKRP